MEREQGSQLEVTERQIAHAPVVLMRRMPAASCDHLVSLAHNCPDCANAAMEANIQYWLERSEHQ